RGAVRRLRGRGPQGRSGACQILGSDGHAALGNHVRRHDAALSPRPRSFHGARDDRPPRVRDRDRSAPALGSARELTMQDEPSPIELTKAVADFLRNDITPLVSGHQAFKLRVAINILDLVTRQLTLAKDSDAAEAERLAALLGMKGSIE